MPFHVMLIPTLGCPANCSYCWSSEEKSPIMSIETIKEVVEWLKTFRGDAVTFTFHGGEPLLAGAEFYREALPLLVEGLSSRKIAFAIQTNLWKMTPEIAEIFAEYGVPIGSSLDGPKELNDLQRGKGYYDKTMRGYEIAREHGLNVRFITTFTSHSVKQKEEIFNFYLEKGLTLKLHPCLPSLKGDNPDKWTLAPEEYGELLIYLLDKYLENLGRIDVMNIDQLCKCVFTGRGTVCTYVDCMGDTFAVGPEGNIYPCYRFVGMPEYVMGNVYDRPTMADLAQSEAWKQMHRYKEYVDTACNKCAHIKYCRGGCPYNAIVPTNGEIKGVDPHCTAYKMIFDEINKRVNEEMFGGSSGMDNMFMPQAMKPSKPGIMSLMLKKL
ncbi:putative peptide-modifying radical SAM enzyme [Methanosarcina sp. A14]|uniref:Putative arylsulfatase regulatory protein n=1 Tax=Methanosarcina barkeri MS TaxID=1434108 RepID=A0A0E3LNQ8_METBA|nr:MULTISPECIES: TIGR04083 family peptide-modifying radical SAM enzyme [Methanosarcina]AKB55196.1 Putative arylsulfatase regulatory protein [Methanosarcina barkeri MS]OED01069.1 putative peptide-modifying radical SAM enzyme [Methanosarcina sp. A14]